MGESEWSSSELGESLKGHEFSSMPKPMASFLDTRYVQRKIIESSLSTTRAVLRQRRHLPARFSLEKLKKVSYQAEDVIDEINYAILRPKLTVTHFKPCFLFLNYIKLYCKVQNVKGLLREIEDFHDLEVVSRDRRIPHVDFDLVVSDSVIGREADASKIVNLLTHSSHQRLLTVVPIVGIDGLGKTALVKFVSQQVMALGLFDVIIWVSCVSKKCDELKVLGQMFRSLNTMVTGLSLTDKEAIVQQLEKELARKRFLLVLDDVCEDVSSWWGGFRTRVLEICTINGNVVLATTRSQKVASHIETSSQLRHVLDFLSDDECWFILKSRAFRNVRLPSNLEVTGREIANKCRGVPLAAKVLGGTLGFNKDEESWLKIRDNRVLNGRDVEKLVKSVLRLSFDHFDSMFYASRPCFALCSVFPKGVLITKEDLILLWMAEGFVHSYDMGNEYFQALLENAFFQDIESDDDGNVTNCKMHNLVHDLALSVEKSEMRIHYLYADYQSVRTPKALPMNKAKYLRTIILNGTRFQCSWNSKRLRTLYLNDVEMETLPSSISKLKHFKYLHISNAKTRPLLKSITEINMLQILILVNCSCEQLPLLGDLPCLKFLKISHMKRVKCISSESYEGNGSRQFLKLFPALKSLSLSWMENLTEWSPPSHPNRVVIFSQLESLSIQSCAKLTNFPVRDLWALVKIEIKDCEELRFIFDDRRSFLSVTSLSIVGCPQLYYLRNWLLSNESYVEFRVRRCQWLKFIPDDLGMQRSLVSLQIYCCRGLRFFSEEILGKLTRLRKLSVGAFSEKLDDFCYLNRIKNLRLLKELEIWGSDVFGRKMCALPNQIQHLARLESLKIKGFTAMEALPVWLPNLQSLKTISLNYCWHLEYRSTTAIIQRLPNLNHVYISGCCALEEHKSQWMDFSGMPCFR